MLVLSIAWTLIFAGFPAIRRPKGLLSLTLASLPILCWLYGPAWVGLNVLAFLSANHLVGFRGTSAARWRRACGLILAVVLVSIIVQGFVLDRVELSVYGRLWRWSLFDMFLLLRWVMLLWEAGAGKIRVLNAQQFLVWTALPVTCVGPFLRYTHFLPQWDRLVEPRATRGPSGLAWWRQFLPVAAFVAVAAGIHWLGVWVVQLPHGLRLCLNIFLLTPWNFLLVAAAVFRTQEILGQRMGLDLPPSFDRPFGRPNLSDFWANWNQSVTGVFRDLIFYNRWGCKKSYPYLNCLILFTLVGLWHKPNYYWLSWGFLHGCGFAVFLWWRKHRDTICPVAWRSRIPGRTIWSAAFTYVFVCAMWTVAAVIQKRFG